MNAKIIKISLLMTLFLVSYFLKGMPVQYAILPLVVFYIGFLNLHDIWENKNSLTKNWNYAIISLNLIFLVLASSQLLLHIFSLPVMIVLLVLSASVQIFLLSRL